MKTSTTCTVVQSFYIDIIVIKPNSACQHRNLIQPALTASLPFKQYITLHSLYRSQYRNILAVTFRFLSKEAFSSQFEFKCPSLKHTGVQCRELKHCPKTTPADGSSQWRSLTEGAGRIQLGFSYSLHLHYLWITNQVWVLKAMQPPSVKVT